MSFFCKLIHVYLSILFVHFVSAQKQFSPWVEPHLQASLRAPPPSSKHRRAYESNGLKAVEGYDGAIVRFKQNPLCETTEGVNSYSGYVDLDENSHLFFWFFEARKEPEKAPVTLWLNGGPGSDSLIGLFNELGPCTVNPDLTTSLNPSSWTEASNMIFLSQPLGVGLSYENVSSYHAREPTLRTYVNATVVDTTALAAVVAWRVVQSLFAAFPEMSPKVVSKEFHLWTESYGGHYGPGFMKYFLDQNKHIAKGEAEGIELELKTLGIGNGIVDAAAQFPSYPEFAVNNTYGINKVDPKIIEYMQTACMMKSGCLDQIWTCRQAIQSSQDARTVRATCSKAVNMCRDNVENPFYAYSGLSPYDIRRSREEPIFPEFFLKFLNKIENQKAMGVDIHFRYEATDVDVYYAFQQSGDYVVSDFLGDLVELLESGVRVTLYYGDADYIGNWFGGEAMSLAVQYPEAILFRNTEYENVTFADQTLGKVREYGNLNFLVVYDAGHLVPAYVPEFALEMFRRAIGWQDMATGSSDIRTHQKIPFTPDPPVDLPPGFPIKNEK